LVDILLIQKKWDETELVPPVREAAISHSLGRDDLCVVPFLET
jgi:hypothetical protein